MKNKLLKMNSQSVESELLLSFALNEGEISKTIWLNSHVKAKSRNIYWWGHFSLQVAWYRSIIASDLDVGAVEGPVPSLEMETRRERAIFDKEMILAPRWFQKSRMLVSSVNHLVIDSSKKDRACVCRIFLLNNDSKGSVALFFGTPQ